MSRLFCVALLSLVVVVPAAGQRLDLLTEARPVALDDDPTSAGREFHATRFLMERPEGQASLRAYHDMVRSGQLPVAQKRSVTTGSVVGFRVANFETEDYEEVQFTLKEDRPTFRIWVETAELTSGNVTDAMIEELRVNLEDQTPAASYDPTKGVIVLDEEVFGPSIDVDSDGKSDVLLLDIRDSSGGTTIQGFVDPANASGLNLRDILHLNTASLRSGSGTDDLFLTAAHEYQHLIHLRFDPGELTFVNEGLSEWAEVVTGYGPRRNVYWNDPTELRRPFFDWRGNSDPEVDYDYQRAGLFTNYIAQRTGIPSTGSVTRSTGDGAAGYATVLPTGLDFAGLLLDFHIANSVNDAAVDPAYSQGGWFPSIDAAVEVSYDGSAATSSTLLADGQSGNATPLEPGAVAYHRWTDVADFVLRLDALPGSGSIQSMRNRLKAALVGVHVDGSSQVTEVDLGGEEVLLSGSFSRVTLVITNVDLSLPAGFNSSQGQFEYEAAWSAGSSTTVAYDNGVYAGPYLLFSNSSLGMDAQVANLFSLPSGWMLSGLRIANYYDSFFQGSTAPPNPKDYTIRVFEDQSDGDGPGDLVLEIERTDVASIPSTQLAFDEIDLTPYASQLSSLSGDFFVAITNAGTDANHLAVPPTELAATGTNPSWLFLEFDSGWGWANFATLVDGDGQAVLQDRVAPIRALFTVGSPTGADSDEVLPTTIGLEPNYPNPFNPTTGIAYELPASVSVHLAVYDLLGREVAILQAGVMPAGRHQVRFDATDLNSGVYLYSLRAGNQRLTRSMLLLK